MWIRLSLSTSQMHNSYRQNIESDQKSNKSITSKRRNMRTVGNDIVRHQLQENRK